MRDTSELLKAATPSEIRKGRSRNEIIGRVLELQHAALLVLTAGSKNAKDICELNDAVRSLLDAFWKVRK